MSSTRFKDYPSNNDFDLDSYLEEKAEEESYNEYYEPEEQKRPTFRRNAIAIGVIVGALAMWTMIGGPSFFFPFSSDDSATVTTFDNNIVVPPAPPRTTVPRAPVAPPAPTIEYQNVQGGYLDYLEDFNNQNLNMFSDNAIQAFYNNGVPIQYLKTWKVPGLLTIFLTVRLLVFIQVVYLLVI